MIKEILDAGDVILSRNYRGPIKIRIGLSQLAELKQECYERYPMVPIDVPPGHVESFMGMVVEPVRDMQGFELVSLEGTPT